VNSVNSGALLSNQDRLVVKAGSTDAAKWAELEDTRSFVITVGAVTRTITPNFGGGANPLGGDYGGNAVTTMAQVLERIQHAVNAGGPAGFGLNVLDVAYNNGTFTFSAHGNVFTRVQRLEDPADPLRSLLGPLDAGIYRSRDNGITWQPLSGPAVREMSHFRTAGRIEMSAHIPEEGSNEPLVLSVATLQGVRNVRQNAQGGQLYGICRWDSVDTTWRYVMDTPYAADLDALQLNQAVATVAVGGAEAINAAYWRDNVDIANTRSFNITIGGQRKAVNPRFGGLGADPIGMVDVAVKIAEAINHAGAFGANAVEVTWDGLHQRFLIVSKTLLPITEVSGLGLLAGDSIFNKTLGAHFRLAGDIDAYSERTIVKVAAVGNAGQWRALGTTGGLANTYAFSITVGPDTHDIVPDFTQIPNADNEMAHVAMVIETATNDQFGAGAVSVLWDADNSAFLFVGNKHLTITLNHTNAPPPLPPISLFGTAGPLADAHFGAVQVTSNQTLTVGTAGTGNVASPADWKALGAMPVGPGVVSVGFFFKIGGVQKLVRATTQLNAIPNANATMGHVAAAFEAAINHNDYFGADAVSVFWNAATSEFVFMPDQRGPLVSMNDFVANNPARLKHFFDRALSVHFTKVVAKSTGTYNRQLEAVITIGTGTFVTEDDIKDPERWEDLGDPTLLATIGTKSFRVKPDFSGVIDMGNVEHGVARATQDALNQDPDAANVAERGFGTNATIVTWDEDKSRFIVRSNTLEPIVEISSRGLGENHMFDQWEDLFFDSVTIRTDFGLLRSAANFASIRVSTHTVADWNTLGDTREFEFTLDGIRKTVRPNFGGVGGLVMDPVCAEFKRAIEDVFPGHTVSVVFNEFFDRLIFQSTTANAAYNGVALIGAPALHAANKLPLVEQGRPYFITGTNNGIGTVDASVLSGSSDPQAFKGLGNRFSFRIHLRVPGLGAYDAGERVVTPDFRNLGDNATMASVSAAIMDAIDAAFAPELAARWVTVSFNEHTHRFDLHSNLTAGPDIVIHNLREAAAGRSFVGPAPGAILFTKTGRYAEKYTPLNPGEQGGKHFSLAVDPTDSDFIYVGGDCQDNLHKPQYLMHSAAGTGDYVGVIFRVDTALSGTLPRTSPAGQDQLIGKRVALPFGEPGYNNVHSVVTGPHADSRSIIFLDDGTLVEVDDGGIFMLDNPSNAAGEGSRYWLSLNGNLTVQEFGDIAYATLNDMIIGGAQDVGNQVQSGPGSTSWTGVSPGDGNINVAAVSGNDVYTYSVGNNLRGLSIKRMKFDHQGNLVDQLDADGQAVQFRRFAVADANKSSVLNDNYDGAFDGFDSVSGAASPMDGSRIAFGRVGVYFSSDNGETWTRIRDEVGAATPVRQDRATALAFAGDQVEYLYVATSAGRVLRLDTDAPALLDTSEPFGADSGVYIRGIAVDPTNWQIVYVLSYNDIRVTTDGGANWHSLMNAASFPEKTMLESVSLAKMPGADLKITDRDGNSMEVVLRGATHVKHVVHLINRTAELSGVAVEASTVGQTFQLDYTGTGTTGVMSCADVPDSHAAADLGLSKSVDGNTLSGDSVYNANLTDGLELDDLTTGATVRLNSVMNDLLLVGTDNSGVFYTFNPRDYAGAAVAAAATPLTDLLDGKLTVTAAETGALYNGITVKTESRGTDTDSSVNWDPVARVLTFRIVTGTTTETEVRAVLTGDPVLREMFTLTVTANAAVGAATATLANGRDASPVWRKLGSALPNAAIDDMEYHMRRTNTLPSHDLYGDALVVATHGRGVWKVPDLTLRGTAAQPELKITGSAREEEITLAMDHTRPWMVDVYFDKVLKGSYNISSIYRITVSGNGGNDTLKIDADLHVQGGIFFDAGAGSDSSSIQIYGSNVHTIPPASEHHAGQKGVFSISKPGAGSLRVFYTNVRSVVPHLGSDKMNKFKKGFEALSALDSVNSAFGSESVPLVGTSLATTVAGAPPAVLTPIALPYDPSPEELELLEDLRAQGLTEDDMVGGESFLARFLNGGPMGDFISELGDSIGDFDAMRDILDDLDDIADNVSYEELDDEVIFDMRVETKFAGEGAIDMVDASGMLNIQGDVVYSFNAILHLVFGVDEHGFFIDPDNDAVDGPEVTLTNLNLLGTVEATGSLGFIQVKLSDGHVTVNEAVSIAVDFLPEGAGDFDEVLGEDPGVLRLHELTSRSMFDLFELVAEGTGKDDGINDLIFEGTFGVALLIPGQENTPLTIASAGLRFNWDRISHPIDIYVEGTNTMGNLLAKFLNLDFKGYFLQLLEKIDWIGEQINTLEALDEELPVIKTSINGLFVGPGHKIGELLQLHDAVESYFDKLETEGGFPSINEFAQVLMDDLDSKMEGSGLGASLDYNDGNPELSINLVFNIAPELLIPFDLGPALEKIGLDAELSALVKVKAEFDMDVVLGIDIN